MNGSERRLNRIIIVLAILTLLVVSGLAEAQTAAKTAAKPSGPQLSLEDYIHQVAGQNEAYKSSELAEQGAELRSEEWTLLTAPSLFANATHSDDQREAGSALSPSRIINQTYNLGLSQQTRTGLQARLLYNYSYTDLTYPSVAGLPPGFLPAPEYSTAGPVLELTQSFGRNGFGSETRATQSLLQAQVNATKYSESFRQTALRAEAESVFWRLALAREAVAATEDTLERAKRIQKLNAGRARLQLSDRADLLQADAAVYAREFELQNALDEEKAASRAFNTLRGTDSDTVPEVLPILDRDLIQGLKIPERAQFRDDVKAADERRKAAQANAEIGVERNRPVVDAFASLGLNGRDTAAGRATQESFSSRHPNYAVGVRLTVPLDLKTLDRDREGYKQEKLAAEVGFRRSVFEQERLWNDLNKRFNESQERLKLARRIEAAQKEKLDYEKDRQRRGRSTTFQVIQFEQDYANAQLARIRIQAEVLNVFAQLKTFGGGQ